jgi:hypothetical protein
MSRFPECIITCGPDEGAINGYSRGNGSALPVGLPDGFTLSFTKPAQDAPRLLKRGMSLPFLGHGHRGTFGYSPRFLS